LDQAKTFALSLGDAYHQAMEFMYSGKPLSECLEVFDEVCRGSPTFGSSVSRDASTIRSAIEAYYSSIYPMYAGKVDVVELSSEVLFPDVKIPFQFRMDLVTKDGVIVDHKTAGGYKPSVVNNDQLNLYSYAYMLDTGRLPRSVELHFALKAPRGKKVEVASYSPKLPEVLRTVSRARSFLRRVEIDDFPVVCGRWCQSLPWREEVDALLIKSSGDPVIN